MRRKYSEVKIKEPDLSPLAKKKYVQMYDAGVHKAGSSMGFVGNFMRWIIDGEIKPIQAQQIMKNQLGFDRITEEEQRQFISDNYNIIGVSRVQNEAAVMADAIAKAQALKKLKKDYYFGCGIFKQQTKSISERRQECEANAKQSYYGCSFYLLILLIFCLLYFISNL